MTPEEKYEELFNSFNENDHTTSDEIEDALADLRVGLCCEFIVEQIKSTPDYGLKEQHLEFWESVKNRAIGI